LFAIDTIEFGWIGARAESTIEYEIGHRDSFEFWKYDETRFCPLMIP